MVSIGRAERPSVRQAAILFALFFAAALLATQPLALGPATYLPANTDALLNSFVLKRLCEAVTNPLDALRGGMFHPDSASLFYSEPLVGIGIQALPLCVLQIDHVALFNISYWLSLGACALGAWLLAREITGSASAALVAATVFAFTSANYDSAARLQIVASQWTPICLLYLVRFSRFGRTRDAVFVGLAFAMQALSCVYYEFLLAIVLVLSVPWWVNLAGGLAEARRRIPATLLAVFLAVVLVLPFNLAQRAHLSPVFAPRSQGPPVTLSYFTSVLPTNFLYAGFMSPAPGVRYDALYFPGFIPVALAALFVVWGLHRRDWCAGYPGLKPVIVIGLLAFPLSLGASINTPWGVIPNPMAAVSGLVPGLEQLRVPSRFLMFSRLSLAVVAACAVHRALRRASPSRARVAASVIAFACFVEHWSPPLEVWAMPARPELPEVYGWLGKPGSDPGPILEFPPALLRLRRQEAVWLHLAALHGRPIVNGYSSFRPAWFEFFMETALQPIVDETSIAVFRALDVRTVVVHPVPDGLAESGKATEALLDYARRHPETLKQVMSFSDSRRLKGMFAELGNETVFSLSPSTQTVRGVETGLALSRKDWSCRGSGDNCELAMDGNPATLMRGAERQYAGDFLKVRFKARTRVQAVSIDMGKFADLYPRKAVIRVLQADAWVEVNAELDVAAFMSDMVARSEHPHMVWRFPATWASGFEIRLTSGGQGFRELGIPEVYAYGPP